MEPGPDPLSYRRPEQKQDRRRKGAGFGFASIACAAVPLVGYALQSGPLFLLGGLLAPAFGLLLGIGGVTAHDGRGTAVAGLVINGLVWVYFAWLIFVHGLC